MTRYIVIDDQECDGCETCIELCPEVFDFDEEVGVARVINPEADDECVEEVIDTCPSECIYWSED